MNWIAIGIACVTLILNLNINGQIANDYPNDIGIENDSRVLFVEKFDDNLTDILSRYDSYVNPEGFVLDALKPPDVISGNSLRFTSIQGVNHGGYLYKNFGEGFDSTVFLRYYVYYPETSKGFLHHEGVWVGGYNPDLNWPYPQAGSCGLGDSRLSIAYEIMDSSWVYPYPHIITYNYWGDMRGFPDGYCWGNQMQSGDFMPPDTALFGEWTCVEIMIKLNYPIDAFNGELQTWINGVETGHWGSGFPNGYWVWGNFHIDPNGEPFEGFRWRTDENLKINWIWPQFYHDNANAPNSSMLIDNIVMATEYIGPVKNNNIGISQGRNGQIRIYPNPVNNRLFFSLPGSRPPYVVMIYNMLGQCVMNTIVKGSSADLTGLTPGIYQVRIENINGMGFSSKILKQL